MTTPPDLPLSDDEWARGGEEALTALGATLTSIGERLAPVMEAVKQLQLSMHSSLRLPPQALQNTNFAKFAANFAEWTAQWRSTLPPNWNCSSDRITIRRFVEIAQTDGLPIAWIPRGELVVELFEADNRDERVKVVVHNDTRVIQDCEEALEDSAQPRLDELRRLALAGIAAYRQGHFEAAQALEVLLAESLILDFIREDRKKGSYQRAQAAAEIDGRTSVMAFREAIAMAPISHFFAYVSRTSADPPPSWPNRQASVHFPTAGQYSQANALIVIMLVASLAREVEQLAQTDE